MTTPQSRTSSVSTVFPTNSTRAIERSLSARKTVAPVFADMKESTEMVRTSTPKRRAPLSIRR